jgi:hypothetical protein
LSQDGSTSIPVVGFAEVQYWVRHCLSSYRNVPCNGFERCSSVNLSQICLLKRAVPRSSASNRIAVLVNRFDTLQAIACRPCKDYYWTIIVIAGRNRDRSSGLSIMVLTFPNSVEFVQASAVSSSKIFSILSAGIFAAWGVLVS